VIHFRYTRKKNACFCHGQNDFSASDITFSASSAPRPKKSPRPKKASFCPRQKKHHFLHEGEIMGFLSLYREFSPEPQERESTVVSRDSTPWSLAKDWTFYIRGTESIVKNENRHYFDIYEEKWFWSSARF
jgi:hypothetical protein